MWAVLTLTNTLVSLDGEKSGHTVQAVSVASNKCMVSPCFTACVVTLFDKRKPDEGTQCRSLDREVSVKNQNCCDILHNIVPVVECIDFTKIVLLFLNIFGIIRYVVHNTN